MRVAVVFDATAVRAYAESSIAVGEVLSEINDAIGEGEEIKAGLPVMSLLNALTAENAVHLRRLADHPAVTLVGDECDHMLTAGAIAVACGVPGDTAALRASPLPALAELAIDISDAG